MRRVSTEIRKYLFENRWIFVFLLALPCLNESFPTLYSIYHYIYDSFSVVVLMILLGLMAFKKEKISSLGIILIVIQLWWLIATFFNYPLSDIEVYKKTVFDIKNEVDGKIHSTKVPCHNDSLVGNWVLDGNGKLYLIDWEYSGMNEAMWDLSCLSIEADYSNKDDDELMRAYFERDFTLDEKKYFIATKLYVDYLWTLWGLTRIPYDGQFMQEYADNRYGRLKKNIKAYKEVV